MFVVMVGDSVVFYYVVIVLIVVVIVYGVGIQCFVLVVWLVNVEVVVVVWYWCEVVGDDNFVVCLVMVYKDKY